MLPAIASPTLWLLLVLVSATLHIRAEYRGPRWQVYLFKPLTTGLIIGMALLLPASTPAPYKLLIIFGLLFSLSGDIFLMLPEDRFVPGLVSFLIAHICYSIAFTRDIAFSPTPWALALYLTYGAVMLAILWPHLGSMRLPVLAYMGVILAMGWLALERWLGQSTQGALLAAVGAALFVVSDSVLALNRFRQPFDVARSLTLTTYFAAQYLIGLSVGI